MSAAETSQPPSVSTDVVWLDGQIVPRDEARIAPDDRGFLLADGLFETMLARHGRIVRLPRHAARLAAGALALGLPTPPDAAAIAAAAGLLLAARHLDGEGADAALRLTFTRGPGPRGLEPRQSGIAPAGPRTKRTHRPTLLLTAAPLLHKPGSHPPASAMLSRYPVAASPLSRHKTLAYTTAVAARVETRAAGADLALRPNGAGRLAGADAANLFVLHEEALITPPFAEGALAGTTRAALLALAPAIGLRSRVTPLAYASLLKADAVLVSSALVGLREIATIDGRPVGRRGAEVEARLDRLREALALDDCDCL